MSQLHIGTMGWSYTFWLERFYPVGLKSTEYLKEYSKHFQSVEIDSSFYRIPSPRIIERWREQTPENFIFTAKFPQKITHEKGLMDCEDDVRIFLRNISRLGDKLGTLLIQLPYSYKREKFEVLKEFLNSLPQEYHFALEVKNKKWLEKEFYNLLREKGVALALIDHPWMPEMNEITSDFTYIRWEGDRRKIKGTTGMVERDRKKELEDWAFKIENLITDNIEVFGYFSKYYSGYSPSDATQLLENIKT